MKSVLEPSSAGTEPVLERNQNECGAGTNAVLERMRCWNDCGAGTIAVLERLRCWNDCGAGTSAVLERVRCWNQCGAGTSTDFYRHWTRSGTGPVNEISGTRPGFCLWPGPPARPMDLAGQILLSDWSEGGKESEK